METVFAFFKYAALGFLGLIALLFVLALLFGKRVRKKWEFEAEFRDEQGREFGEVDIELSKIEKEERDYTFKAKLYMRHAGLEIHDIVQVLINDTVILEGIVEKTGRIRLGMDNLRNRLTEASSGQICKIMAGTTELARAELVPD